MKKKILLNQSAKKKESSCSKQVRDSRAAALKGYATKVVDEDLVEESKIENDNFQAPAAPPGKKVASTSNSSESRSFRFKIEDSVNTLEELSRKRIEIQADKILNKKLNI